MSENVSLTGTGHCSSQSSVPSVSTGADLGGDGIALPTILIVRVCVCVVICSTVTPPARGSVAPSQSGHSVSLGEILLNRL